MRRQAACLLLLLVLLAPAAQAFRAEDTEVDVAYASTSAPLAMAFGQLDLQGRPSGFFMAAGLGNASLGPVPELVIASLDGQGPSQQSVAQGTLVIHEGLLFWELGEATALALEAAVPYGIAMGIPQAPMGEQDGENASQAAPALVLAANGLNASATWSSGEARLLVGDAIVSVLDAEGQPVTGWERRSVNAGFQPGDESMFENGRGVVFLARGPFAAQLPAALTMSGAGESSSLRLQVAAADVDGFADAMTAFATFTSALASEGGAENPMDNLKGFSGLLNGAILLMRAPAEEGAQASPPPTASIGGEEALIESFAVFRARDMSLAYGGEGTHVEGTSAVALTQGGFAVQPPASVWLLPLVSVLLWCVAGAAIALFFTKRPPKGQPSILLRLGGAGAHLLAFGLAFWLWDRGFAATFGTSFLTLLTAPGTSGGDPMQLMLLLGLQMIPWGLAALLFALPVRIAAGVALRYGGRGKSLRGFAGAAGLVSLGILGPIYALWMLDLILGLVMDKMPAFAL